MRYEHLISRVESTLWAIEPAYGKFFTDLLYRRTGEAVSADDVRAATVDRRGGDQGVRDGVGIVQLYGPIFPKANLMTESSGCTSCEEFAGAFEALCANADVAAIVIDCDSPGGAISGVQEAYDRMVSAKSDSGKTVVAVANHTMASAAYWLCCAADEIVASPSSLTGAIGVFKIHESIARKLEADGTDVTIISAGEEKVDGNPFEALSDRASASMQSRIDAAYNAFTRAVADGRNTTPAAVRSGYGRGAPLTSGAALDAGLVDRVGTMLETVDRMRRPQARAAARRRRSSSEALSVELAQQIGKHYGYRSE